MLQQSEFYLRNKYKIYFSICSIKERKYSSYLFSLITYTKNVTLFYFYNSTNLKREKRINRLFENNQGNTTNWSLTCKL